MAVNEQVRYPRKDAIFHMTQLPVLLPYILIENFTILATIQARRCFFFPSSTAGKHENLFSVYKM